MGCHFPNQGIYVPYQCLDGRMSRKFIPKREMNLMYRNGALPSSMDDYVSKFYPESLGRGVNSCKKCVICRLNYSKEWAIRCMHEASMHRDNVFITLTYHPDFLPAGGTLLYRDFQLFNKRFD